MIKRDTIWCVVPERTPDGSGGSSKIDYKIRERYDAHVSETGYLSTAVQAKVGNFGLHSETIIETVTSKKLDDDPNHRYKWNHKLFQLLRQVHVGNEWFATLQQVTN